MAKHLNSAKVFERAEYKPHDGQRKIHKAGTANRFRCVCAGRRTGKSTLGGHELLCEAYRAYFAREELDPHEKRMEYWIVGPEYSDAEKEFRVLWADLKRLGFPLDHPGSYNDAHGGDMHVSLWGGRYQVHAKSAKYPQNLVGEGLHGVILAEAAKLKQSIWTKYIRPMLADYHGWALMTSTPEGKNWFYDTWMNAQKGMNGWWSTRMPSWTNDIIFPGGRQDPEILAMEEELTEESFKQEVGADFSDFVGRVFKNFDEEIHCRPLNYNPALPTFAAVDYGWTNPFVWLLIQEDVWGNVYVIDEYYHSHKRIDEIPDELRSLGLVPNNLRTFYPDPAEPGDTRILEDKLLIQSVGGTGGPLKDRLRLIRKHLEIPKHLRRLDDGHPDKLPKLFVDSRKCPNTVREMNDYRYPENKRDQDREDSEAPLKKDDHTPEALGRYFAARFKEEVREQGPVVAGSSMG